MAKAPLPTHDRLRQLITYCPDAGAFAWAVGRPGASMGKPAGRVNVHGYYDITVDRCVIPAGRLAFFYMTGEWPAGVVDHIDRNPLNNAWSNLRDVTHAENCANGGLRKSNTSGVIGVTWDAARGKWRAQARIGGKKVNLGRFDSKRDAEVTVKKAVRAQWGDVAVWANEPDHTDA